MMAGIDYASGEIIIPMDGDMQNDPADIPKLIKKLEEGADVCSGWRVDRQDNSLKRVLPSKVANWLISKVSGVPLHDYGCSLKAYRASVLKDVRLYGEMHRFIPIYASWQGAKITECPVNHYPREHGVSKYGLERILKVLLDLIVVKFLSKYAQKPIYVFGGLGVVFLALAFLTFLLMLFLKYSQDVSFIMTPLPLLSVFFLMSGVQSILLGIIAELLMRTYYESQDKRPYIVSKTRNISGPGKVDSGACSGGA
jgi:glycosyltransferase involved in cell wall biosynthesis